VSKRIIVGPDAMLVERHGIRSESRAIGEHDGPEQVRAYGRELWEAIRPFVSWAVWTRHRLRMAMQRRWTRCIIEATPGPFYPGPRPDLIAIKPWKEAAHGEWQSVPHGVAARLLRLRQEGGL